MGKDEDALNHEWWEEAAPVQCIAENADGGCSGSEATTDRFCVIRLVYFWTSFGIYVSITSQKHKWRWHISMKSETDM